LCLSGGDGGGGDNIGKLGKKVVFHRGGTIKKGRLINVTRSRVAGSDVSVARAANLHQVSLVLHNFSGFIKIHHGFCLGGHLGFLRCLLFSFDLS
jgi:hypothetical protein